VNEKEVNHPTHPMDRTANVQSLGLVHSGPTQVQTLNGVDRILFTGHKQIDTKATNETTKARGPKHFPKCTF
jgi:hypothetical protein